MMEGIKPPLCVKIDCLARKESGDERHLLFSETALIILYQYYTSITTTKTTTCVFYSWRRVSFRLDSS